MLPLVVVDDAIDFFVEVFSLNAAARLQTFWAWSQQKGGGIGDLGPEWRSQRRRGAVLVKLGSQRFPGNSKQGLDHLIKPGYGCPPGSFRFAIIASPSRRLQFGPPSCRSGVEDRQRHLSYCSYDWNQSKVGPEIRCTRT